MSRVDTSLVTSAVVAMLRAAVPPEVLIGDGRPPAVDPDQQRRSGPTVTGTRRGYGIVYQIPGGVLRGAEGYLGEPTAIRAVRFQLVGVGVTREQAQSVGDLMTSILCDRADDTRAFVHTLTVAGHTVMEREEAGDVPQDDVQGLIQLGHLVDVTVQAG